MIQNNLEEAAKATLKFNQYLGQALTEARELVRGPHLEEFTAQEKHDAIDSFVSLAYAVEMTKRLSEGILQLREEFKKRVRE